MGKVRALLPLSLFLVTSPTLVAPSSRAQLRARWPLLWLQLPRPAPALGHRPCHLLPLYLQAQERRRFPLVATLQVVSTSCIQLCPFPILFLVFLVAQRGKNLPAMQETQV